MQDYPDAPSEPVSAAELIQQQQAILTKNAENQSKRNQLFEIKRRIAEIEPILNDYKLRVQQYEEELKNLYGGFEICQKEVNELQDESTEELEASLARIDEINAQNADLIKEVE